MSLHPEPAHTAPEKCDSNSAKEKTNEETKSPKKEVRFPKEEVTQEIKPTQDTRDLREEFRQVCLNVIQKYRDGTLVPHWMQDDCTQPNIPDTRSMMEKFDADASDDDMARRPSGRKAGGKGLQGSLRNHLVEEERRKKAVHMQEVKGGGKSGSKNQSKPKPKVKEGREGQEGKEGKEGEGLEGDENSGVETPKNGQNGQIGQNGQNGQIGQIGQNGQIGQIGQIGQTEQNENGKNAKHAKIAKIAKKSKAFIPFNPQDTLLLVGEGDFSFAVSVLKNGYMQPQNLVATSYDSETQVLLKYSTAGENLKHLKNLGVKVLHEIDATKLSSSLKVHKHKLLPTRLNHIMFNFPHTGRGMKDANRNIRDHQHLVLGYFQSAKNLLQTFNGKMADTTGYFDGEFSESILLTVFEGEPYISWGIKALARNIGYKVERSGALQWEAYSGYSHRRTDGMGSTTKRASDRSARTYVFTKYVQQEESKAQAVHSDSD